jgi:hypothetical protein
MKMNRANERYVPWFIVTRTASKESDQLLFVVVESGKKLHPTNGPTPATSRTSA